MKEMKFEIEIIATQEKVWDTLWQDTTFRQWAGIIDPGTYMVGKLIEGHEIQFISGNGYGVTSLVERVVPNEFLSLKHKSDTKEIGTQSRDNEWTGGKEIYSLTEESGVTTLTFICDVPTEMVEYFDKNYPKALNKVKELSEK